MTRKSQKIAARINQFEGRDLDAHYLAYFDCFNQQLFYEAHDVLEELWLTRREDQEGDFYKALIQLAGAFVHLQKQRLHPAASLLQLSQRNFDKYPAIHHHLNVQLLGKVIQKWLH